MTARDTTGPEQPALSLTNLLADLPLSLPAEQHRELARGGSFRLDRIVSTGQTTPPGEWYDQDQAEWVVVLTGQAVLQIEGEPASHTLRPGDCLNIPAHVRHRVEWTDPQQPTVWLAVTYES